LDENLSAKQPLFITPNIYPLTLLFLEIILASFRKEFETDPFNNFTLKGANLITKTLPK